jgi:SsrA-binding protein
MINQDSGWKKIINIYAKILNMTVIVQNKRALYDYEILDKYEAGIQLKGFEAKAVRAGKASISGAYAIIRGGEVWLINAKISPYQEANIPSNYQENRSRKLLMKKSEIKELLGKISQKGLTLIPLKLYTKGRKNLIKVELALAKGRKIYDKRELLKKKEAEREMKIYY